MDECTELSAAGAGDRGEAEGEAGCEVEALACLDHRTHLGGSHRCSRLGLASAQGRQCGDVGGDPALPRRLR